MATRFFADAHDGDEFEGRECEIFQNFVFVRRQAKTGSAPVTARGAFFQIGGEGITQVPDIQWRRLRPVTMSIDRWSRGRTCASGLRGGGRNDRGRQQKGGQDPLRRFLKLRPGVAHDVGRLAPASQMKRRSTGNSAAARYILRMLVGVDTGGTFTDFVALDDRGLHFSKELSTPHDPCEAILRGLEKMTGGYRHKLDLIHGSTVATNAILERKGVRTLFVTNRGLEDLLVIGRQTRAELYALCPIPSRPRVERGDCFGIGGRVDASGKELVSMDIEGLKELSNRIRDGDYEAVAVCLLFSFLNPEHEKRIAASLPAEVFVSLSHEVLNEYHEYERAAATYLNAYVGPLVQRYLERLDRMLSLRRFYVMHSAGGVMSIDEAGRNAVRMVLSGPAGGLVAARFVGEQLSLPRLISFDMGGTSTDVSLLTGDELHITTEAEIADFPVAVPMLDIHTIGAGGGSIAWRDTAGLLRVGPESTGADPGPACYGRGGKKPTVTDANVVLGRIPASVRLAGDMAIDVRASEQAVAALGREFGMGLMEMAQGIVRVAEENMAAALRVVSVERGHDPRQFALVCFGGAGGLHACSLAAALGIPRIVLPVASGAFSTLGMLAGRRQCDLSQSRRLHVREKGTADEVARIFRHLEAEARRRIHGGDLRFIRAADMRYRGQGFHLTIPCDRSIEDLEAAFGPRMRRPTAIRWIGRWKS
jgi:N-methylhydantoinase A/acetone carboxylase, beta subunit